MSSHANWLHQRALASAMSSQSPFVHMCHALNLCRSRTRPASRFPQNTRLYSISRQRPMAQQMRFGVYSLFKHSESVESVLFVDTETMNEVEQAVLGSYAAGNGLAFMATADFIKEYRPGSLLQSHKVDVALCRGAITTGRNSDHSNGQHLCYRRARIPIVRRRRILGNGTCRPTSRNSFQTRYP